MDRQNFRDNAFRTDSGAGRVPGSDVHRRSHPDPRCHQRAFPCWLRSWLTAATVELTAKSWSVFSIGRVFAYLAVGFVENAVPGYTAELAPAPLRGFLSGSLLFIVTLGNLWGTGMSRAYVDEKGRIGWMVPTGVQLVPPVAMLLLIPFTPESPRWLIARGRSEAAQKALNRVRPKHDVDNGTTLAEVEAFEQAVDETRAMGNGRWIDLFRGTYFRRAMVCDLSTTPWLTSAHRSQGCSIHLCLPADQSVFQSLLHHLTLIPRQPVNSSSILTPPPSMSKWVSVPNPSPTRP